jgi:hypothetical protein
VVATAGILDGTTVEAVMEGFRDYLRFSRVKGLLCMNIGCYDFQKLSDRTIDILWSRSITNG